jgi:phage-related protein
MPTTEVFFYVEKDGHCPVIDWLQELRQRDRLGFAKCVARIRQLAAAGHELRRPAADYLQDGISELRAKHGHVQYRLLYFFCGKNVTVIAHALIKSDAAVPSHDIARALQRKALFEAAPARHTYYQEIDYAP